MKADARPLLFEAQEARLEALDALARNLWLGGLTNAEGELEPRLAALAGLRRALVDGALPPAKEWPWPGPALVGPLTATMAELDLAGYCEGQQELADTLLMSLLFHIDFIVDYQDRGCTPEEARATALAAFAADWQERCGEMDELKEVFGLLPDGGKHTRWDLIRGLLRSEGWQDVVRIRKLLERLPELAGIIRGLGRARQVEVVDEASLAIVQVMDQAVAQRPESR
ncbi:MAG TPA: VWA domain-containing protein, partial [Rhodocyclaceae bacterium]|nr:VWA domain-containing protein [Rhodocyclaceae bacterium]